MRGKIRSATEISVEKHVGARIRMRRIDVGMSQEQLGAELGVTFQQVQKYERGINRVGGGRLAQAAKALRVDVAFFYDGADVDPARTDGAPMTVDSFMATGDGVRIAKAFPMIADRALRSSIVSLIEAAAASDGFVQRVVDQAVAS